MGGQDELVFDGASLVLDTHGQVVARAPQFVEDIMVVDVDVKPVFRKRLLDPRGRSMAPAAPGDHGHRCAVRRAPTPAPAGPQPCAEPLDPTREIYEALVLGTRDYVTKNGFTDVVIGLSGGVDSSLVATIAVDALGADHVHGVMMPSKYSSDHSLADAKELAAQPGHRVAGHRHRGRPPGLPRHAGPVVRRACRADLAEENIQARIRGTTLMALSNKFGWLVLATGNKSEMAVGFSTLYGDLAGGFAVIKDVVKTTVYELCRDRNRRAPAALIPEAVLTKPPSAELRPDQRDDQSLPPTTSSTPSSRPTSRATPPPPTWWRPASTPSWCGRVVAMVDRSEYKRRQAPPGVRVTPKAFGKDRRLPITNRYRG